MVANADPIKIKTAVVVTTPMLCLETSLMSIGRLQEAHTRLTQDVMDP